MLQIHKTHKTDKGAVLIMALLILGIMLFLGGYFLSFVLTGSKMVESHEASTRAYYLAEAGIQEAIFKLKNDAVWKSAFETPPTVADPFCASWLINPYTRNPALFNGASYEISVANLGCAKAEITSAGRIQMAGGAVAQKVVKTKVFKALSGGSTSEFTVFTGGPSENIEISAVNPLRVYGGSMFSNNILRIKNFSNVWVENKALASNNILLLSGSQLTAIRCAGNICDPGCSADPNECPPAPRTMPPLDFDSASPNSYLSSAQVDDCSSVRSDGKTNCVFTLDEFEKVMWDHYPSLILPFNTVAYVTGDVNVRAGQDLTVQGVLVSDRDVNLGEDFCWTRSEPPFSRCGNVKVTVQRPGAPSDNLPSGILAKRKVSAGGWLGIDLQTLMITGLVYAGDEAKLTSIAAPIEIHGGVAARKFSFSSLWSGFDFYLDADVITDTFQDAQYSPFITIDHWEEKY